jgi:hypothetical protein
MAETIATALRTAGKPDVRVWSADAIDEVRVYVRGGKEGYVSLTVTEAGVSYATTGNNCSRWSSVADAAWESI